MHVCVYASDKESVCARVCELLYVRRSIQSVVSTHRDGWCFGSIVQITGTITMLKNLDLRTVEFQKYVSLCVSDHGVEGGRCEVHHSGV